MRLQDLTLRRVRRRRRTWYKRFAFCLIMDMNDELTFYALREAKYWLKETGRMLRRRQAIGRKTFVLNDLADHEFMVQFRFRKAEKCRIASLYHGLVVRNGTNMSVLLYRRYVL